MGYTDKELLTVDPELAKIFAKRGLQKLPIPNRKTLPIFRERYSAAIKKYTLSPFAKAALGPAWDKPTWTENDRDVTVRDGSTIKIRTYEPKNAPSDGLPVMVWVHGGGWIMGDLETEAFTCRILAARLNIVIVNIDFRLYPDVEFPVPVYDCIDVSRWVAENASSISGNLTKGFIVGGNSGGATYAAVAVHLAREEKLAHPVTGCYYSCPIFSDELELFDDGGSRHMFDLETENRSFEQNKDAPIMNREMQRSIATFATFDWQSPYVGPFHGPAVHWDNIPRTYVQVCGMDPWRDTGVIYEREIREAGAETRLTMYPGLPHAFWTTFPQIKATQQYLRDMLDGMKWLLRAEGAEMKANL